MPRLREWLRGGASRETVEGDTAERPPEFFFRLSVLSLIAYLLHSRTTTLFITEAIELVRRLAAILERP